MACSDHGSDALIWAAGRGDSEHALLDELITLSRGASSNRECHQGDTALTMACSRREDATSIIEEHSTVDDSLFQARKCYFYNRRTFNRLCVSGGRGGGDIPGGPLRCFRGVSPTSYHRVQVSGRIPNPFVIFSPPSFSSRASLSCRL